MNIILIALSIKYNGDWDKIYEALEKKERIDIKDLRKLEEELKNSKWTLEGEKEQEWYPGEHKDPNYNLVTILDKGYPSEFKNIYKPPFCVWMKGDSKKLKKKTMCVAGNQRDQFSDKRIKDFVPKIENVYNIISPGFVGVDEDIVKTAINPLVNVLACGMDKYKGINEKDFYITEYPEGVSPIKENFRNRNRLIAGISEGLILFTSKKNGKINNLVTEFLNVGKEIFAFPGDGGEEDGNSELIKQGANLITSIKDVSTN